MEEMQGSILNIQLEHMVEAYMIQHLQALNFGLAVEEEEVVEIIMNAQVEEEELVEQPFAYLLRRLRLMAQS